MIRRMICFFMMVFLIFSTVNAYAMEEDAIDVSSMSLEELLQLKEEVDNEIIKRGEGNFVFLPSGRYVAGRDIAPGMYTISCYKTGDNGFVIITVFAVGETADSYDAAYREYKIKEQAYQDAINAGEEAEMPEMFDKGKYVVFGEKTVMGNGEVSVYLEEGQTLSVSISYDRVVTISQSKGLFMD